MKIERLFVEDIDVGNRLRPMHEAAVVALAESMQRLGQLHPISVYSHDDNTLLLVTGLHRLEAAKRLRWDEIDAVLVTGNEIERELQEIAENLHRSELTALERDTQIGRWAGVRKVARELNLGRKDVERAVKVASISPEAKQAARVAGLDDNRTALLAVAKEATPEAQVAKVGAISSAKTSAKAKDQVAATNVVEATHLVGAVNRFAEFCRANSPASVAAGILPGEVAEVRVSVAVIREWRRQFFAALGRVEATDIAAKAAEGPRGPDVVPLAERVPVVVARDDPVPCPAQNSGSEMGEFCKMEYDAWDQGNVELSLEEEAAYLRLCHQMYRRNGPVPNSLELLCTLWRCNASRAKRLLFSLLSKGKIDFDENEQLTNNRTSGELANREQLSASRAHSGRLGGTISRPSRKKSGVDPDKPKPLNKLEWLEAKSKQRKIRGKKEKETTIVVPVADAPKATKVKRKVRIPIPHDFNLTTGRAKKP